MRKSEVYISSENRRACAIVARSEGSPVTVDEIADRLLSWALTQRYPGLDAFQREIKAIEEKMAEALKS